LRFGKEKLRPQMHYAFSEQRNISMTDAQIGLMVATPAIIGFSLVLYRMGALQGAGTLSAVAASIVIAIVLFFGQ
jgi:hypothetical protein